MRIQTVSHGLDAGWSAALPTDLDSAGTLVVAFGAPEYADAPAALGELVHAFPKSTIVGCSSAGEIHGDAVTDRTLVLAVARFERTDLAIASTPITSMADSALAGMQLGARLASSAPRLVLVLSDGLAVNGTDLVRGLVEALPAETMIVGGLAADGDRFARTWVLVDGAPKSGHVTAVGLSGRSRSAPARRAAGTPSDPSAASRARVATSSTSSTASRRWRSTRIIWTSSRRVCRPPRCAFPSRSARRAATARRLCARSSRSMKPRSR
jgi:hypothetical protein